LAWSKAIRIKHEILAEMQAITIEHGILAEIGPIRKYFMGF